MIERLYNEFTSFMGKGEKYDDVPASIQQTYKNVFMGPKDETDILPQIWANHGLRTYKNGLFQLVNPDEYNEIARTFANVSDNAIVFAKSLTGCLFLWEEYTFGRAISHLNVHTGINEVIGANFCIFFEWDICERSYWNEDCYGKIEFKALKKFKKIGVNESVAFFPALALGGAENIENMQIVTTKEHLEILSQL